MKKIKKMVYSAIIGSAIVINTVTTMATPVNIPIYVKHKLVKMDVKPELRGKNAQQTTFVPISFIGQKLGAKVSWSKPKVTVKLDGNTLVINTKTGVATKNGDGITLEEYEKPFVKDGRVMVPLRFISEQLDYAVIYYNKPEKKISIVAQDDEENYSSEP